VRRGRAVQVAPIKPTLKAPGTKHLKLKTKTLLSHFGFKFNLRHYNVARAAAGEADTFRRLADDRAIRIDELEQQAGTDRYCPPCHRNASGSMRTSTRPRSEHDFVQCGCPYGRAKVEEEIQRRWSAFSVTPLPWLKIKRHPMTWRAAPAGP